MKIIVACRLLLGNDRKTAAVERQQPVLNTGSNVGSSVFLCGMLQSNITRLEFS
jgi:hypothetical protein